MTRMREVGQPGVGRGPVAAHDWEPLPGSCALGPWPTELLPVVLPELKRPAMRGEVLMEMQDGQPEHRRLAGIDLGIASRHAVRVLEADGQAVCRASCVLLSQPQICSFARHILAGQRHFQSSDTQLRLNPRESARLAP
jgi:hypothetical protein